MTLPILGGKSAINLFDVNALRLIEGIYVFQFMKFSSVTDVNTAFLLKTGRKINQSEIDFQNRLANGENTAFGIYESNWNIYCAQAIYDKCGILHPSTEEIRRIYKEVLGYYPSYDDTHIVNRLVRYRKYDLFLGYYIPNIWQVMQTVAALDAAGLDRKVSSISALFNKIYKREPRQYEIDICKKLDLNKSTEDIRHEITSVIAVKGEANYRRTWKH